MTHDRHDCPIFRRQLHPCADCGPSSCEPAEPMCRSAHVGVIPLKMLYDGDPAERSKILGKISAERNRHKKIGYSVDHTLLEWLRILSEELGEIAEAMANPSDEAHIEEEAVQLASGCVAMMESMKIRREHTMADANLGSGL